MGFAASSVPNRATTAALGPGPYPGGGFDGGVPYMCSSSGTSTSTSFDADGRLCRSTEGGGAVFGAEKVGVAT